MSEEKKLDEELEVYRTVVRALIQTKKNELIYNGKSDHAAILFEQFLLNAKESVRFFCKNLSEKVFGLPHVVEALKKAIKNEVHINILVQSLPDDTDFYKEIIRNPRSCTINEVPAFGKNENYNFSLMDDCAYRYEKNNGTHEAIANMFDPDTVSGLIKGFNALEQSSTPIKSSPALA